MILSAIMISMKGGVHPILYPINSCLKTFERMQHLYELVTCTPATFQQFCSIRLNDACSCAFPEFIPKASLHALVADSSWIFYADLISTFSTLSDLGGDGTATKNNNNYCPDGPGAHFFDTYSFLQSMLNSDLDLDTSYFF